MSERPERVESANAARRELECGDWYWINRWVLRVYGSRLKPSGLAVYNALAAHAHSKTQACYPTQKTIAALIGVSRRTVIRRLKQLADLGLIRIEHGEKRSVYCLLKPQVALKVHDMASDKSDTHYDDVTIKVHQAEGEVSKTIQIGDKDDTASVTPRNINNNKLIRLNNNMETVSEESLDFSLSKNRLLALDVAKTLNDPDNLPIYLFYCKKYPDKLISTVLREVMAIPSEKIVKSRASLFNHLIRRYVQKHSDNCWY